MPDSTVFGYGGRIDPWGTEVTLALNAAASIGLDWIGIDFDWARHWPDSAKPIDLKKLDDVIRPASKHELNLLVSIVRPPAWAITAQGPDLEQTIKLVITLAETYPEEIIAIELLPYANTKQGWGANPNPVAYTNLIKATQLALQSSGSKIILVAAGLTPVSTKNAPAEIDDREFLSEMYKAGAASFMQIISLRLDNLKGEVMSSPYEEDAPVMRRYEIIRQIMLKFNHPQGLLWVTGFTWPASLIDQTRQVSWTSQAYQTMKSQLYIGVAFFEQINPGNKPYSTQPISLVQIREGNTNLHPALTAIAQMINLHRNGQSSEVTKDPLKKISAGIQKSYLKPY